MFFSQIDPDTGELLVASALDREVRGRYNLIVEVWDNFKFGHAAGESRNAFVQLE